MWVFFVSTSSICEGALSLVNYTRRYARKREKWGEMSSGGGCGAVCGCRLMHSLLASLAPLVWRRLNVCQKCNKRQNDVLFKCLVARNLTSSRSFRVRYILSLPWLQ